LQKIPWANEMRQFVAGMNAHKNADLAAGKTEWDADMLIFYEMQYDDLLETVIPFLLWLTLFPSLIGEWK